MTTTGTVTANKLPPLVDKRDLPSAKSAHDMFKALGIEVGFVVVATMVAGVNDTWGSGMVTLMLAILVLRGLFEVDIFTAFASGLSLQHTGVPPYDPSQFTGGGGGQFGGHGASGSF